MRKIKVNFTGWSENDTSKNPYEVSFKSSVIYDVLIRHYELEISDKPDYLFSSVYDFKFLDFGRTEDCIRILFSQENYKPDFNLYDYVISSFFDFKYQDRYFYLPPNLMFPKTRYIYDLSLKKHLNLSNIWKEKKEFCSYVVSNSAFARQERTDIFYKMCEYKKVNSGGRYLNNIGEAVENKLLFNKQHKFSIAFENNMYYTTEKIAEAFAAQTVPIYWGNPAIVKEFNEKAFVNCHKYKNFDEVVRKVEEIDKNDELYLEMLRTEAWSNPKASAEYMKELEEFLVHIIETPKVEAVQRDRIFFPKRCEKVTLYGAKKYEQRERLLKNLAKVGKPLKHTKVGLYLKHKLKQKLRLI